MNNRVMYFRLLLKPNTTIFRRRHAIFPFDDWPYRHYIINLNETKHNLLYILHIRLLTGF